MFMCLGHAFSAEERCVCAGYDNGDVKMFDLKSMKIRWEDNVNNGVNKIYLILCVNSQVLALEDFQNLNRLFPATT